MNRKLFCCTLVFLLLTKTNCRFAGSNDAMKKIVALILIVSACQFSLSQRGVSETGLWSQYFFNVPVASEWSVNGDLQYRTYEIADDFQQFIARAHVMYRPDSLNVGVAAGYAYLNGEPFGDSDVKTIEHRLHQDLTFNSAITKHLQVNHRFRLEERFIPDEDFRSRLRYLIALNIPLCKDGVEGPLYIALWNEIFLNGEKQLRDSTVDIFDRNWSQAGLGYRFSDNLQARAGYMRELTNGFTKGQILLSVIQDF